MEGCELIIVPTSNKYAFLMVFFAGAFNKFWFEKARVDVVCYDVIPAGLPDNFVCHSMGRQEDYGKFWTNGVRKFVEENATAVFTLFLDDYLLEKDVDYAKYNHALQRMLTSLYHKFDLTKDVASREHSELTDNLVIADQNARYRTSLQAAIWDKKYFLKYCVDGRDAWEFETVGYREAFNDGAYIYGTKDGIVQYRNAMVKGVLQ